MTSAALHDRLHARFRETFGDPQHTLGPAAQWSFASDPTALPVNVLLNGAGDHPSVWIFDPRASDRSAPMVAITQQEHVEAVIARLQQRLGSEHDGSSSLSDHPARIGAFVRALSGWSACIAHGDSGDARAETEKVRLFGLFLAENRQFGDAYRDNVEANCRSIDRWRGLNCLCTFLNAVADLVRPVPVPGHRYDSGSGPPPIRR
jgi:hypothetical protein